MMGRSFGIKVCGMRDGLNIEEIAALGPTRLGFIFVERSPRYFLRGGEFRRVPGIQFTGVFSDHDPSVIGDLQSRFDLSVIQLHGGESPEYCKRLREVLRPGTVISKALAVQDGTDIARSSHYASSCDELLFDTASSAGGGAGRKFNWELLGSYREALPVYLAGGIGPEDASAVRQVIDRFAFISGIDLNSRFEVEPGIKSRDLLQRFMDEVRR